MANNKAQREAYSYLRFSSPEQAKGDSFRRQSELAAQYARHNGLKLDESLTFYDLGISAYRGVNSETGQLGSLLEAVKSGLIPKSSVILVESLDRISRQSARKALRIIESILEFGVSIVTLTDGREYTLESLDTDPLSLLMAILTFIRANEESAIKSQRVAAAWETKRKLAPQVLITAQCPGWMKISEDRSKFILIGERVKIIKRIFDLATSGTTLIGITRVLNSENIPPLRARGKQGKYWTTSSVLMILKSETVFGTYTPFTCRIVDGKLVRTKLDPIEQYYPPIIGRGLYNRVQEILSKRLGPSHEYVTRPLQNIIGYITRCGYCDSGMVKAWGYTGQYLLCRNALLHAGCSCCSVRYHEVEASFMEVLKKVISKYSNSKNHSLRIWCSQVKNTLSNEGVVDKSELNRLIRKECTSIKIFHDIGRMEIHWKNNRPSNVGQAFIPSSQKSTRSKNHAEKMMRLTGTAQHK